MGVYRVQGFGFTGFRVWAYIQGLGLRDFGFRDLGFRDLGLRV